MQLSTTKTLPFWSVLAFLSLFVSSFELGAAPPQNDSTHEISDTISDAELTAQISTLDPPEDGFFAKKLLCHGLSIKASAEVADAALVEAWRRIDRQLKRQPKLTARLVRGGSELQIIGKNQGNTDLPEFRHLKGKPYDGDLTMDERCRGVGGKNASCGEENLLKLRNDRYFGRDICSHEFTHTMHMFGASDRVKERIHEVFIESTQKKGLWKGAYAASNELEYLAEMTMWYFGTVGDCGTIEPRPQPGRNWLKKYDPDGFQLVDDFYSGRLDPL